NLQIKFARPISGQNEFVAFIDAIGQLDGRRSLIEWKTTASRYSEAPDGLLALDPQLVCYSWMTGFQMWRWWFLCASGWWKCNICGPRLPRSSARNSESWSETRSSGSSRPSFCRTAAFAFHRTPALSLYRTLTRTSGFGR